MLGIRLILIGMVLLVVVLTSGGVAALLVPLEFKDRKAEAEERFEEISRRISRGAMRLEREGEQIAVALAANPDISHPLSDSVEHPLVDGMSALLHKGDHIFSAFIGHPNGDYIEVSNLEADPGIAQLWQARPGERWVINKVFDSPSGRVDSKAFLDRDLEVTRSTRTPTEYRANERPWFQGAAHLEVHRTEPYRLAMVDRMAVSFTSANEDGYVAGAITLLSSLDKSLDQSIYPDSYLALFVSDAGGILAGWQGGVGSADVPGGDDDPRVELLKAMSADPNQSGQLTTQQVGDERYYIFIDRVASFDEEVPLGSIVLSASEAEVLAPVFDELRRIVQASALVLMLGAVVALWAAGTLVRPIRALAEETDKIRQRMFGAVRPVSTRISELGKLSLSLVNMAENIQRYQRQQQELHDSIVRLIADAIDQKSPYTAGHCERVPELGIALASAASDSVAPAFEDFEFRTEDSWREFRLAAWLHDCGKITTPEHIVDKGSKLEAQYNRIHEVRMRFEVLLRDAHIHYLEQLQRRPETAAVLEQELAAQRSDLMAEFAFVAECNVGGEFMDEQRLARLREIGSRTWQRYLDNRLGLSPAEELHAANFPSQTPAEEPLLADRPEHLFHDPQAESRYEGLGFTLRPGEYKQNLGEIYNLSVQRGTLTSEDRYIINEHIIATIKMLESLPWPDDLSRIPEYAGGHHEKLDGTGYPRSLAGGQLSVPARVLAVADVMEALTASDRPYKKAKPLSVALAIMVKMAGEQHLDPDLVGLLITSGVYRSYADRFLAPEQLDEVDEGALLAELATS